MKNYLVVALLLISVTLSAQIELGIGIMQANNGDFGYQTALNVSLAHVMVDKPKYEYHQGVNIAKEWRGYRAHYGVFAKIFFRVAKNEDAAFFVGGGMGVNLLDHNAEALGLDPFDPMILDVEDGVTVHHAAILAVFLDFKRFRLGLTYDVDMISGFDRESFSVAYKF